MRLGSLHTLGFIHLWLDDLRVPYQIPLLCVFYYATKRATLLGTRPRTREPRATGLRRAAGASAGYKRRRVNLYPKTVN